MSFPKELCALPQWICWRLEPDPKGEKPKKVPYDPKNGRKASSTNPQTWATLTEAQAACTKFMFTGIGFVFTEASGIVGVDIRITFGCLGRPARSDVSFHPDGHIFRKCHVVTLSLIVYQTIGKINSH